MTRINLWEIKNPFKDYIIPKSTNDQSTFRNKVYVIAIKMQVST